MKIEVRPIPKQYLRYVTVYISHNDNNKYIFSMILSKKTRKRAINAGDK